MDHDGPTPETLKGLSRMMRGYMVQRSQGHFQPKVLKGKSATCPDHVCTICGTCWGKAPLDSPMVSEICELCKVQISDGEVAIVSGNRYVWVRSEHLKQSAPDGVIHVTSEVMDKIGLKFLDDNADKPENPSRNA